MPSKNRQFLLSCLVIAAVTCLCLSVISIVGAGVIFLNREDIALKDGGQPTLQETPLEIDEQMDLIERQMSELRGLEAKATVSRNLLTPEELRQRVLDDFLKDYTEEEAREDALVLWSFGLLDRSFNLYDFYLELYSEQIAGFYDQETKEMYVVQDNTFAGPERLTYAHEFTHALQDQHYDIEKGLRFNDKECEHDSERCAAISALLEGDASFSESQWLSEYATQLDKRQIFEYFNQFDSPVYDSAPAFMKDDFLFPYQQGQAFVESIFNNGGWQAVDQAYLQLPISTEQILHPDQYPDDAPIAVEILELSTLLGDGWQEIDRGVMGEWYTYLILSAGLESEANLPEGEAQDAAAGWEGDTYVVLYNESLDQISLVLYTLWDSEAEAQEFGRSFESYASARFGNAISQQDPATLWQSQTGIQALYIREAYTAWIAAADAETVASLWKQLANP